MDSLIIQILKFISTDPLGLVLAHHAIQSVRKCETRKNLYRAVIKKFT